MRAFFRGRTYHRYWSRHALTCELSADPIFSPGHACLTQVPFPCGFYPAPAPSVARTRPFPTSCLTRLFPLTWTPENFRVRPRATCGGVCLILGLSLFRRRKFFPLCHLSLQPSSLRVQVFCSLRVRCPCLVFLLFRSTSFFPASGFLPLPTFLFTVQIHLFFFPDAGGCSHFCSFHSNVVSLPLSATWTQALTVFGAFGP